MLAWYISILIHQDHTDENASSLNEIINTYGPQLPTMTVFNESKDEKLDSKVKQVTLSSAERVRTSFVDEFSKQLKVYNNAPGKSTWILVFSKDQELVSKITQLAKTAVHGTYYIDVVSDVNTLSKFISNSQNIREPTIVCVKCRKNVPRPNPPILTYSESYYRNKSYIDDACSLACKEAFNRENRCQLCHTGGTPIDPVVQDGQLMWPSTYGTAVILGEVVNVSVTGLILVEGQRVCTSEGYWPLSCRDKVLGYVMKCEICGTKLKKYGELGKREESEEDVCDNCLKLAGNALIQYLDSNEPDVIRDALNNIEGDSKVKEVLVKALKQEDIDESSINKVICHLLHELDKCDSELWEFT